MTTFACLGHVTESRKQHEKQNGIFPLPFESTNRAAAAFGALGVTAGTLPQSSPHIVQLRHRTTVLQADLSHVVVAALQTVAVPRPPAASHRTLRVTLMVVQL